MGDDLNHFEALPGQDRTGEAQCTNSDHSHFLKSQRALSEGDLERASRIFRALGEPSRLRLAARLTQGSYCVSELADAENEPVPAISQRLRVLRADNIVRRRRDGKHMLYFLADNHMRDLVLNGLAHAAEGSSTHTVAVATEQDISMTSNHEIHEDHAHEHEENCGHTAIQHNDHVDYLHDGHLHSKHDGHIDEHAIEVSSKNPDECTDGHECSGHDADHKHGADCGHEAVPHGDHVDYLVDGHLHHQDGDHCDNHGPITVVA